MSKPLKWDELSPDEQRVGNGLERDFNKNFAARANAEADALVGPGRKVKNHSKAARLRKAADADNGRDATLNQAARNESGMVKRVLGGELAVPGRDPVAYDGSWYPEAGRLIQDAAPNTEPRRSITASSIMSPGTNPETERKALGALERGRGTHVQGDLFEDIPGSRLKGIIQDKKSTELDELGLAGLRGPNAPNVGRAHDVMRGAVDPQDAQPGRTSAPKTWGYTEGMVQGAEAFPNPHNFASLGQRETVNGKGEASILDDPTPGVRFESADNPVGSEYLARGHELKDKVRGRVGRGQQRLDLYGKVESSEGLLGLDHTAQDTWMRALHASHKFPEGEGIAKAYGDVPFGGKQRERVITRGQNAGQTVKETASAEAGTTGESVNHAWHNEATRRAAQMLDDEFMTTAPTPPVLSQTLGWTGIRRVENADPGFNGVVRGVQRNERQAHAMNKSRDRMVNKTQRSI